MSRDRLKVSIAILLNGVAGFVDTTCFIALYHVYVANMTGNTMAVAEGIGFGQVDLLLRRGLVIPAFVSGLFASRICVECATRLRARSVTAFVYALEAVLLAIFIWVAGPYVSKQGQLAPAMGATYYAVAILPAFSMGLQNAALTHFGPLTVRTTHVTGNLAELAEYGAKFLLSIYDRKIDFGMLREAILLFAVWLGYLVGGLFGVALKSRLELAALWVPVAILSVVAAADVIHPFGGLEGEIPTRRRAGWS